MKYIKLLALSLMLLVSYSFVSKVQATTNISAASQIVAYYNTQEASSLLQITNTNLASGVTIHVQILDENCNELNYFDNLTAGDTDVIDIDSQAGVGTRGMIIINAVGAANDFVPIDFPHLIASQWLVVDAGLTPGDGYAHYYNALGRDVDSSLEFELNQPENVLAPYSELNGSDGTEFVTIAWTDLYGSGGDYIADSGTAATTAFPVGVFMIDDEEAKDSCGDFTATCVSELGVNPDLPSHLDVDTGTVLNPVVCDKNFDDAGLVQLLELDSTDNSVYLDGAYEDSSGSQGGMDYAITVAEEEIIVLVEVCNNGLDDDNDGLTDCADTTDCAASNDCAEGGLGACDDDADNDNDGDTDCEDEDCDGVDGCEFGTELSCGDNFDNDADGDTDCADGDCSESTLCQEEGGGGGGGGSCSIAGSSVGLANALLLLIPAIGIAIRRRLIG